MTSLRVKPDCGRREMRFRDPQKRLGSDFILMLAQIKIMESAPGRCTRPRFLDRRYLGSCESAAASRSPRSYFDLRQTSFQDSSQWGVTQDSCQTELSCNPDIPETP